MFLNKYIVPFKSLKGKSSSECLKKHHKPLKIWQQWLVWQQSRIFVVTWAVPKHCEGEMKKISDFVIYSNLLIAAGASCFILETYILFDLKIQGLYALIGFAATLFTYNVDRLVVLKGLAKTGSERHNWIVNSSKLMIAMSLGCIVFLGISLFYLPPRIIMFLAVMGLVSIAYSVPILGKGVRTLRSIKLLKIFLINGVWAASTVFMPLIASHVPILQRDVVLLFIERSLFIFAITLPFDIRDHESDKESGVKTIPGLIGLSATKWLAFFCLLVYFLVNLVHYDFHSGILLAKLLSGLSTLVIVLFVKQGRHEYYFTGLLDGTIIIQFVLVTCLAHVTFFF